MTEPAWRRTVASLRREALAPGALLCAIAAYFLPWIAMRRVFHQVDIAFMDHPVRVHAFEQVRAGRLPLWTDALLGGFPLFGEGQAGVLYPLGWLYVLLPAEAALNAFVVTHFLILGLTAYLFLRLRPVGESAALVGALSLVFSSFMLVEHVLLAFISVVAWLPLLLVLGEAFVLSGRRAPLVAATVVVAVMHLAGDALATSLSALFLLAFLLLGVPGSLRRRLVGAVVPLALGTLLAAVQLVPTLVFLRESTRHGLVADAERVFVPGHFLLTVLWPSFFGDSWARFVGPPGTRWEETVFFFFGWAPLFLVPFAVRTGGRWRFWIGAVGAGFLLSLACFQPVGQALWALPPLSLFRWPGRALLWSAVGMAVLAALGLDDLLDERRGGFRGRWVLLALTGVSALALYLGVRSSGLGSADAGLDPRHLLQLRDRDAIVSASAWTALLLASALWRCGWLGRRGLIACFGAVVAVGAVMSQRPGGLSPGAYGTPEVARFLSHRIGARGRLLSLGTWEHPFRATDDRTMAVVAGGLPPNLHLLFGLRAAGQFDETATATLRRHREAMSRAPRAVLDLLGVEAVVAPAGSEAKFARQIATVEGEGFVRCFSGQGLAWCCQPPRPRAFLVHRYRVLDAEGTWAWLAHPGTDLRAEVALERQPRWPPGTPTPAGQEGVGILRDEPGRVVLDVRATRAGLVVLGDTHYPGWRAEVDGQESEVLLADGFVRAVAVGPGRHRVVFSYRPPELGLGLAVSLMAAGCAVVLARPRGGSL